MVETKGKIQKKLFCCYYAATGNVEEAAKLAGFQGKDAIAKGAELLRQPWCQELVEVYRGCFQQNPSGLVQTGLNRLALGHSNDAIQLLYTEGNLTPEAIDSLDLFSVSSIKKDKAGGVEIHFFDRIKALETLYQCSNEAEGKAAAQALMAALGDEGEEN